jgi:hypothetical protein
MVFPLRLGQVDQKAMPELYGFENQDKQATN